MSDNPSTQADALVNHIDALIRSIQPSTIVSGKPPLLVDELSRLLGENFTVFVDDCGRAYLRLDQPDRCRLYSLDSAEAHASSLFANPLARLLVQLYRGVHEFCPTDSDVRESLDWLRFLAHQYAPRPVFDRFGYAENAHWLDLADSSGSAVRLVPSVASGSRRHPAEPAWQILDHTPVAFRRHPHQLALPAPQPPAGDYAVNAPARYDPLRRLFPALADSDWLLVLAWLVAALHGGFPVPMLVLVGPPGAGKTTFARLLRRLLDPSALEFLPIEFSPAALARAFSQHALPAFDNLGRLSPAQSNLFCRAVTGGGFCFAGASLVSFRRPLLLTSLELPSLAPDWLDRALVIPLASPSVRHQETYYWEDFRQQHPQLLGLLLDLFCRALQLRESAQLSASSLPRMADFAVLGSAVAAALGHPPNVFAQGYAASQSRLAGIRLDHDPLAQALLALLASQPRWQGTAQALLQALSALDPALRLPNCTHLGVALRRLQFFLPLSGVELSFQRQGQDGSRQICLARAA